MIAEFKPVSFHANALQILDQRELPEKEKWITITRLEPLIEAISSLAIRGAPLLGFAGLVGVLFALRETNNDNDFIKKIETLINSRPTAVNLSKEVKQTIGAIQHTAQWTDRMNTVYQLINKAIQNGKQECEAIAETGLSLIEDNDGLLTHCNSGSLATLGIGTALGIIKKSYATKKNIRIYHTETRPLLQGSRLTAYELQKCRIPSVLVIDSAISSLMASGNITKVIVGADRIAKNGDTANKIGTLTLAIAARYYHIPFFVAAPTSTFDEHTPTGKQIMIELRQADELILFCTKKIAPLGTNTWNPAFDVTPKELISAFITETGINPL